MHKKSTADGRYFFVVLYFGRSNPLPYIVYIGCTNYKSPAAENHDEPLVGVVVALAGAEVTDGKTQPSDSTEATALNIPTGSALVKYP